VDESSVRKGDGAYPLYPTHVKPGPLRRALWGSIAAMRLAPRVALLIALVLLLASRQARAGGAEQDLAAAEQAYVDLDLEKANQLADALAHRRGLSHEELVRTYRLLARTHAVLGHDKEARDAFVRLLTYAPDEREDKKMSPRVTSRMQEARGTLITYSARPGVEAAALLGSGSSGGSIHITTRDPTHVVKRVALAFRWGNTGRFAVSDVTVGEDTLPLPAPPAGVARLDYWVQAYDDLDDVVFEVGNPSSPKTALVTTSATPSVTPGEERSGAQGSVFTSPIFWLIAGGVVAAGAATGAYFLTRGSRTETLPPMSANLEPGLMCAPNTPCR
jgi:hypothetical protein